MKKILIALMLSILFSEAPPVVAAISKMKGDVKIRPSNNRKYESAYKGQMVRNGDWIKTDFGVFLGIIFLDGSTIKIHENTEIDPKFHELFKESKKKDDLADAYLQGIYFIT